MTTTLNASTAGAGGFIATSDNSGVLALQTAGTTAITVDASQQVGIGGTPIKTLSILPTSIRRMDFYVRDPGVDDSLVIRSQNATNNNIRDMILEGSTVKVFTGAESGGSGSERMRIDSSGNVGIGVTPSAWQSGTGAIQMPSNNSYSQYGVGKNAYYNGTSYIYSTSSYATLYQQNSSGQHLWLNAASGTAGNAISFTQAMTLDASGNLLVGTTTASSKLTIEQNNNGTDTATFRNVTASPYGLYCLWTAADPNNTTNYLFAGRSSFSATNLYTIWSNGTTSGRSDARLKKNIEPARGGYLQDVCRLEVVKYNWYNHEDTAPKEIGLIAQQVETVFPNLVITDDAGLETEGKSIKHSVIQFMLLKAIQELKAELDELKAKVNA